MAHTVKQLEELRRRLSELPVPDDGEREVNKREAIAMLASEIGRLQKKGYSYEMIAKALSNNGLDLSVSTLKSYITKAKRTMQRRPRRKPIVNDQRLVVDESKNKSSSQKHSDSRLADTPSVLSVRSSAFTPRSDSVEI